ncbi:uncharacterized protein F4822DRAFT_439890 [Hypoxylon trugodes]|uniref:uncharacterized protein n=1 Tax=Hypoxylon trugodes TaxID=326681 RepID=UPI0021A19B26|nr:uncharacterized protein F4822DRAFT_439890 [Hypoxylon trugodes]KAI1394210.1 hypothetical protein F4822DRAFT_439890 [Hypoxylon trugodes]
MSDLPQHAPLQWERNQLHPQHQYQQSFSNPPGQFPGGYQNHNHNPVFNQMSPSSTIPSILNPAPAPVPTQPMHPGYDTRANNLVQGVPGGFDDNSGQMSMGMLFHPQHNGERVNNDARNYANTLEAPTAPMVHSNQWQPGQYNEHDVTRIMNLQRSMNATSANISHAPQSGANHVGQPTPVPGWGPSMQQAQIASRPNPPIIDNEHANLSSDDNTPIGPDKNDLRAVHSPRMKAIDNFRISKAGRRLGKLGKVTWQPGMKEKRITDKMTKEERAEASEWNDRLAEAKAEHVRTQNRESAQRSRKRKVEELENTKDKVKRLQDENTRLNKLNMSLKAEGIQLRARITVLNQQLESRSIANPNLALPIFMGQDHNHGLAHNHTPVLATEHLQNTPQVQGGTDFTMSTGDTSPQDLMTGVSPENPIQQLPQPDGTASLEQDPDIDWNKVDLDHINADLDPIDPSWDQSGQPYCE